MAEPDFSAAQWFTSTRSADQGQCVELAAVGGWIGIRDSKRGDHGPVLTVTCEALSRLVSGIKDADTDV